ncbi:MAG: restriction endonuclease [Paracoccaceae bacterium]|nr:restriction endonuclease [Paracoccaceae bacterium]
MFHVLRTAGFDIEARNHASAILAGDFGEHVENLVAALIGFRIGTREIIQSGGGHAEITMRLRNALVDAGWRKHTFVVKTTVDGEEREAISHEVDHVLWTDNGTLALEIEWNNKDPFFDRDLENFQRLHAQGAISVGILITRGASLQSALVQIVASVLQSAGISDVAELEDWGVKERTRRQMKNLEAMLEKQVPFAQAFARSLVSDKFGMATTHWSKLTDRVLRGVGNPCPLLLIGLPVAIVGDYSAASEEL